MSNEETKNVEDKQNNSLMRKTKAQLVEIILRKDNIERGLRADIKGTETYCKELEAKVKHVCNANKEFEDKIKHIRDANKELKEDYHNMCDESASLIASYKNEIKQYRIYNKVLSFILFLIILISATTIICM